MKRILFIICISLIILNIDGSAQNIRKTVVTIKNDQFLINGKPTYENRYWKGYKIEGLLMNSRMLQGIFDAAVKKFASWGYFDYRMKDETFIDGYQSVPVDWGINSQRKTGFFNLLKEITGTK